jgi:transcriptional regulator with XRE-family HTH domain
MDYLQNQFRAAIRTRLTELKVTDYRFCKDTGISESQFSRFMRGERGVSFETLERILYRLNLTWVDIRVNPYTTPIPFKVASRGRPRKAEAS